MIDVLDLGNRCAEYAFYRNLRPNTTDLFKCIGQVQLAPEEFDTIGSPDMVSVYPVKEGDVCLNFFRQAANTAYIRLPFGENMTATLEAIGGYTIDHQSNNTTIPLTDEQKDQAIRSLQETMVSVRSEP